MDDELAGVYWEMDTENAILPDRFVDSEVAYDSDSTFDRLSELDFDQLSVNWSDDEG